MLNKILAISGKPGLYRFLSKGNKMIIVESIDDSKRRLPAYATDKIVALSDISIYTNDGKEVKLADVFNNAKKLYDEKEIDLHYKKASQIEIVEVFSKILPQYDKDRVHVSDMRKYSLNDFSIEETAARNEESE